MAALEAAVAALRVAWTFSLDANGWSLSLMRAVPGLRGALIVFECEAPCGLSRRIPWAWEISSEYRVDNNTLGRGAAGPWWFSTATEQAPQQANRAVVVSARRRRKAALLELLEKFVDLAAPDLRGRSLAEIDERTDTADSAPS